MYLDFRDLLMSLSEFIVFTCEAAAIFKLEVLVIGR